MSRKVKGINYDPIKDKDIIDYIDKKPNISKYILGLVEKDMMKDDISSINKDDIKDMIKQILEQDLVIVGSENSNRDNMDIANIDLTSVNDILNL